MWCLAHKTSGCRTITRHTATHSKTRQLNHSNILWQESWEAEGHFNSQSSHHSYRDTAKPCGRSLLACTAEFLLGKTRWIGGNHKWSGFFLIQISAIPRCREILCSYQSIWDTIEVSSAHLNMHTEKASFTLRKKEEYTFDSWDPLKGSRAPVIKVSC